MLIAIFYVQGGVELTLIPAVTALLFHHSGMDTGTDCSVVSTG